MRNDSLRIVAVPVKATAADAALRGIPMSLAPHTASRRIPPQAWQNAKFAGCDW